MFLSRHKFFLNSKCRIGRWYSSPCLTCCCRQSPHAGCSPLFVSPGNLLGGQLGKGSMDSPFIESVMFGDFVLILVEFGRLLGTTMASKAGYFRGVETRVNGHQRPVTITIRHCFWNSSWCWNWNSSVFFLCMYVCVVLFETNDWCTASFPQNSYSFDGNTFIVGASSYRCWIIEEI